ncbi:LemA family protein [Streptococcus sp. H31]|uniref:LemA family protein n=1 Tax=Streptococcus huangxiaojuni TaxID=3237239 RepID=UPI0034A4C628
MVLVLVLIAVLILLVVWVIAAYNGLVRGRMHTKEAWSQIDVQLKRRNDLIPNLLETVKGYAAYEEKVFSQVTKLRAQVAKAPTPNEAMQASDALSKQLSSIFAVAENYPDLQANKSFVKLQEELANTENKISYSRQLFNSTTANYNTKLEVFPTNLVGSLFGFKPSQFLEVPEEEKETPQVKFDF